MALKPLASYSNSNAELRLRSAAARKDGAELARWLAEMERAQVYLSAAGRREVDFWKGGGQP